MQVSLTQQTRPFTATIKKRNIILERESTLAVSAGRRRGVRGHCRVGPSAQYSGDEE